MAASARQITTCPVVTLELFNTARNARDVEAIEAEEVAFRSIPITRSVQHAAIGAVRELASGAAATTASRSRTS